MSVFAKRYNFATLKNQKSNTVKNICSDMDLKTFSEQEAKKVTLDYFCGDELATQVWINKYALKD
ncbi:MAG: hypothetical protein D8B59_09195, partial [Bacteroidetes bacterium]